MLHLYYNKEMLSRTSGDHARTWLLIKLQARCLLLRLEPYTESCQDNRPVAMSMCTVDGGELYVSDNSYIGRLPTAGKVRSYSGDRYLVCRKRPQYKMYEDIDCELSCWSRSCTRWCTLIPPSGAPPPTDVFGLD